MRKEKAKKYFLGQDGFTKLNCAQAVIKAYHDAFKTQPCDIELFAAFGGGRAPEGRCGAFHAAHYLIAKVDSTKLSDLEKAFLHAAGAISCKEIRSKKKLTCLGCVEKAAQFLDGGER